MKIHSVVVTFFLLVFVHCAIAAAPQEKTPEQLEHDKWLKLRFSDQHKKLIPKVAVADMFFACDKAKNSGNANYQVNDLVESMARDLLAEKLMQCLGAESMKSDVALNYGLHGCFSEQLAHLPNDQQQEKMTIVTASISSLSREERQKSFSRCVTDQTIKYLK